VGLRLNLHIRFDFNISIQIELQGHGIQQMWQYEPPEVEEQARKIVAKLE